jgi:hypothetical protein
MKCSYEIKNVISNITQLQNCYILYNLTFFFFSFPTFSLVLLQYLWHYNMTSSSSELVYRICNEGYGCNVSIFDTPFYVSKLWLIFSLGHALNELSSFVAKSCSHKARKASKGFWPKAKTLQCVSQHSIVLVQFFSSSCV